MSTPLNVIALISGGKDSLYSLLHCIQNGHNVVALANLYAAEPAVQSTLVPPTTSVDPSLESDDVDSFMYQTVGHSVVPLYSDALGIPLYRRQIKGTAVQTGRYYDPSQADSSQDETEDLTPLLKEIMQHHPEANAVSSGAILSTYQRTRIESVATRLGLTPLAYLWQYPILPPPLGREESLTGLLDDMAAAGCDSRLIKIATGGMNSSLLGSNVAEAKTKDWIVARMAPFFEDHEFLLRGAVLGEGGEYETLAVRGPKRVWKKRIEVEQHSSGVVMGEGGTSQLRFASANLVENHDDQELEEAAKRNPLVRMPVLFDPQFAAVQQRVKGERREYDSHQQTEVNTLTRSMTAQSLADKESADRDSSKDSRPGIKRTVSEYVRSGDSNIPSLHVPSSITQPYRFHPSYLTSTYSFNSASTMQISNLTAPECHSSTAHQVEHVLSHLHTILHSLSRLLPPDHLPLSASNIISSTLIIASMHDFALVNKLYASLFPPGLPNPPARVTIACADSLPDNTSLSLSVILDLGLRERFRGLHVQGRSYWAPSNIGPYSQAICIPVGVEDEYHLDGLWETQIVHVAGQIPLVPATMELLHRSFTQQATLALQHLWRVGQDRGVDCWTHGVAFLNKRDREGVMVRVETTWDVWRQAHRIGTRPPPVKANSSKSHHHKTDDDYATDEIDLWEARNNRHAFKNHHNGPKFTVGHHLHLLPNPEIFLMRSRKLSPYVAPFIAAEVNELPRHAPVEWHSLGLGTLPKNPEHMPILRHRIIKKAWGRISWLSISKMNFITIIVPQRERSNSTGDMMAEAGGGVVSSSTPNPPLVRDILYRVFNWRDEMSPDEDDDETHARVVHSSAYIAMTGWRVWDAIGAESHLPGVTVVPCRRVWGCIEEGRVRRKGRVGGNETETEDDEDDDGNANNYGYDDDNDENDEADEDNFYVDGNGFVVNPRPVRLSLALVLRVDT